MQTVDLIPVIFVGGTFVILVGRMLMEYVRARTA